MCSVGDAFNIDIEQTAELCDYTCKDCGKEFKGIGIGNIKCPACHSSNTVKR